MSVNKTGLGAATNKVKQLHQRISAALCKIHLVNKCLLILMLLLLSQSAYVLLTNGGNIAEANHIDVIIRTATASIFGYFLSANFVQNANLPPKTSSSNVAPQQPTSNTRSTEQSNVPQNRIGFAVSETPSSLEQGMADVSEADREDTPPPTVGRLQIITSTAIAVFCLVTLIIVRDVAGYDKTVNASTAAIVAQFRDFISGCVGFLIGCPTVRGGSK